MIIPREIRILRNLALSSVEGGEFNRDQNYVVDHSEAHTLSLN